MTRSHSSRDVVTSPDYGSSNIGMNPSSRSGTHQNQTRKGEQSPLSLPLPHRCATGERSKKKEVDWSDRNRWLAPPAFRCRPSGPEERWRDTMVQFTKSMDKKPPTPTSHGRPQGKEWVRPKGLKTSLESMPGSGVFADSSSRPTRLIWLSGQLPQDDLPALTATHTLQESRRVCDSIAWLAGRGDFTRLRVIKHRHESIVAIGNTPEPNAEGRTKPPLPTSPPSLRDGGEGKKEEVDW